MLSIKAKKVFGLLLMSIFVLKMMLGMAPAFMRTADKADKTAITQEDDSKTEKDNADKGQNKDKFENADQELTHTFVFVPLSFQAVNIHQPHSLALHQDHIPSIPTPPPNKA